MRSNLVADNRSNFFRDVLGAAREHEVQAIVVLVDVEAASAIRAGDPALDATLLLLERANNLLRRKDREALVVADEPSGDRESGRAFVAECIQVLRRGTKYVPMDRLPLLVAADSKHTRLIQLSDLVTSCTVAYVGGEAKYSPRTFELIEPMLVRSSYGQVGGTGLKIHPDLRYVNLYHWLVGDEYHVRGGVGFPLPMPKFAYATGPTAP